MMNKLILISLFALCIILTACGPSAEEIAFQTQEAATSTAASWTETPNPTYTLTPTATAILLPTATPTATMFPTFTPTETPLPILNIADEPEYPTGVSSGDPWSVLMFIVDTVHVINLECFLVRLNRLVSPLPESCPRDGGEIIEIKQENLEHFKYLFCAYGKDTDVYSVEFKDSIIVNWVGETPEFYSRYDRRYTYQEYQELVLLQDCRDVIADWEAAHED